MSEAELANLTPEEMNRYEESLKVYRDNKNAMDYAVKVAAEEATLTAHIAVARKMKARNVPVEQIAEFTGLTREEIEKL